MLSLINMEEKILDLIKDSNSILIITHINPDGDTLGCASCLKSFIGDRADILIQIEDNFSFPTTYNFLPYLREAKNFSTLEDKYDLVIAVDTASIDRIIDKPKEIFLNCKNSIVFDHHKTNKGFAAINYIQGGESSCAQVLFDFFSKLNIAITKQMAVGLYTGLLTDSGCFKYESTTFHTFETAKQLSLIGIDISKIADLCYTNKPKNLILFQSELIANANFCLNDKVAYILITKDFINRYNAKDNFTEGIVETLRSIKAVEVALVLKESAQGTKVSIRTKEIDATKITSPFRGGGHKRAAGCTIKDNINKSLELLLNRVKELL